MTKKNKEGLAVVFKGLSVGFWFVGLASLIGMATIIPWLTALLVGFAIATWSVGNYLDEPSTK